MSAIEDIAAERQRQIYAEGWTPEHDDKNDAGQMVSAAVTYALEATFSGSRAAGRWFEKFWPWDRSWFKTAGGKRRMLVKAGALIVAEIDRIDRATGPIAAQNPAFSFNPPGGDFRDDPRREQQDER